MLSGMKVLAIDPGTRTGFAYGVSGALMDSGTWDLRATGAGSPSKPMAMLIRYHKLVEELKRYTPDVIAFEQVMAHNGLHASHLYGGFVALLYARCAEIGAHPVPVPVGTIKKHATGKGNANKEAMIRTAKQKFKIDPVDDNHADALHLFDVTSQAIRNGKFKD